MYIPIAIADKSVPQHGVWILEPIRPLDFRSTIGLVDDRQPRPIEFIGNEVVRLVCWAKTIEDKAAEALKIVGTIR